MANVPAKKKSFVICVQNEGYEVSLEKRKIYEAIEDQDAAKHQQLRIVDESGDDYLFPASFFVFVELPKPTQRAVFHAA
jgi:hypothetical protein